MVPLEHVGQPMLTLLPLLSFCLVFLRCCKSRMEWRKGLLVAAAIDGACVVLGTELLSAVNQVTRGGVAAFWLGVCAGTFAIWRSGADRGPIARPAAETSVEPLDAETKYLLFGAAILVVLIGVTALLAPPNVWDAMEYHLPRVVMWMSDRNVRFFPTPDYAHLVFGTWAEYAMMHLDLLWGSDRLVNLVEFFSFLGTITGVSLIAKLLGANRRGQAFAVLVCATIPEAVLEASGSMNTLVVSFWIVATVAFLLLSNEEPGWLNTVCVGISAGLAILTKGSAYVYLPLLVLACWFIGLRAARMRFLKRCPIFLLLIFALNGPQYARAYDLTGSPMGLPFPDGGPRLHWMVDHAGLRETLANVIRGLSIHTVAPSDMLNGHIERGVRTLISWIGEDPDDPGAVWVGWKFALPHFSVHEICRQSAASSSVRGGHVSTGLEAAADPSAPRNVLVRCENCRLVCLFLRAASLANLGKPPSRATLFACRGGHRDHTGILFAPPHLGYRHRHTAGLRAGLRRREPDT